MFQGGAVFTLADLAFAAVANPHGVAALAAQADIAYLKAIGAGTPAATAEEVSRIQRLSTRLVRSTDEQGELVTLFKGVAYIKGTPLNV